MNDDCKGGFDLGVSARRVCATYRREKRDRVPIMSPIGWSPTDRIGLKALGDWRDEEPFVSLAKLVERHCDVRPPHNAVKFPRVFEPLGYQRFLEAPAEFFEEKPLEHRGAKRRRKTYILHAPKGDLEWTYEYDEGIFTSWDVRKPIRTLEDVEKMLSVPFKFEPPAASEFDAFRAHRAEAGCDCVGGTGVNSMVAMLCGVMSFELLLEWVLAEPEAIKALADAWLERTGAKVDYLLSQGVGPFWHFNGVERASPPMMGPRQWEELVVPYDGEIMRRIKAADPESFIHVHCHGRVGTLLDSFVEMGVDSTDPIEPEPQGDIDIASAKEKYDGRLVFYGNMEFLAMDTDSPDVIEEIVRHAIEDGGKENVILMPSATPHEPPTERFVKNAERYIESALRYGAF